MLTSSPWVQPTDALGAIRAGAATGLSLRQQDTQERETEDRLRLAYDQLHSQEKLAAMAAKQRLDLQTQSLALRREQLGAQAEQRKNALEELTRYHTGLIERSKAPKIFHGTRGDVLQVTPEGVVTELRPAYPETRKLDAATAEKVKLMERDLQSLQKQADAAPLSKRSDFNDRIDSLTGMILDAYKSQPAATQQSLSQPSPLTEQKPTPGPMVAQRDASGKLKIVGLPSTPTVSPAPTAKTTTPAVSTTKPGVPLSDQIGTAQEATLGLAGKALRTPIGQALADVEEGLAGLADLPSMDMLKLRKKVKALREDILAATAPKTTPKAPTPSPAGDEAGTD